LDISFIFLTAYEYLTSAIDEMEIEMKMDMKKKLLLIYVIIATTAYWGVSFWEMSQLWMPMPLGYIINTSNEVLLIFMWIYRATNRKIIALLFAVNIVGEFCGSTLLYRSWEYLTLG
jgi:hypothetical protein